MLRTLFTLASPGGARARLSVLIFHRVLPRPDPLFPEEWDIERFDAACTWLRHWFNVLPLDTAVRHLADGTLPPRAAAITFDDGYADNHDIALPILQRHGLVATFYVASGFLDGGRMWNDSIIAAVRGCSAPVLDLHDVAPGLGRHALDTPAARRAAIDAVIAVAKYLPQQERDALVDAVAQRAAAALPHDLMMSAAQVRALHAAGMQIGAHTVTHPILARLDDAAARAEIVAGKQRLESIIDAPVRLFAYPNGKPGTDYSARSVALARAAGFDAAVSTAWGAARRGSDRFELPRFTPWDRTRARFGARLLQNLVR